jgi:hypothetical protein
MKLLLLDHIVDFIREGYEKPDTPYQQIICLHTHFSYQPILAQPPNEKS